MGISQTERKKALQKAKEIQQSQSSGSAYQVEDKQQLKMKSLVQLGMRNKEGIRGATEYVANYILSNEHIYTLRDDKEEMWKYHDGIYVEHAETYIKTFCKEIFEQAYTKQLATEVIEKIKTKTYTDPLSFFDREPKYRICCENVIVDLLTGEPYEHTPEEFHFSKIPVVYDEEAYCPKIISFFEEVLANPEEDLLVMQEVVGWLLMKEYKPEKALMCWGKGRNGKGKTQEILQTFIGDENYSSVSLTELDPKQNEYSAAQLVNKLANFGGDIAGGLFRDTSVLRGLTGRDKIDANRKYKTPIKFRNYAKLIFAANEPPIVRDDHDGFWSRWVWLDFPYKFVSEEDYEAMNGENNPKIKLEDMEIVKKVLDADELSGMLNWGIEGLNRLLDQGNFSQSKSQDEIRSVWIRKSNSFEAFCMDHLVEDWEGMIEKSELRRAYSLYCRRHKATGVSDDSMKVTLQERFGCGTARPTVSDGSRPRCWKGVRFVDENENHVDSDVLSYSSLGHVQGQANSYRVKNVIERLCQSSENGLAAEEDLVSALPTVDVFASLEYLERVGDVMSPKSGFWRLL